MEYTPHIIILSIWIIRQGSHLRHHGEDFSRKYDWITCLIFNFLSFAVLYWGGFFDILIKDFLK